MGVGGGDEELGGRAKVAPAGWLEGREGDICEDWRGVSGGWRDDLQRQAVIKPMEVQFIICRDRIMLEYNSKIG
jgi:hypothetical protein